MSLALKMATECPVIVPAEEIRNLVFFNLQAPLWTPECLILRRGNREGGDYADEREGHLFTDLHVCVGYNWVGKRQQTFA